MADEANTNETAGETPETETAEFWKQKSRLWESRARENSAAAKKLQELEDANKSELEKAVARAEAAEKQLGELQLSKLRGDIALESGVPADLVDFLTGGDEESLRAQAEKLVARLSPKEQAKEETKEEAAQPSVGPYAPKEGSAPSDTGIDIDAIAKAARAR